MNTETNKTITAFIFAFFFGFFVFLIAGEYNSLHINPKALQDISLWFSSPSFIVPFSTLANLLYYLFFGLSKYFDADAASFYKILDLGFYLSAFLFYLIHCRRKLKDSFLYVYFAFLFALAYFLFPGGVFWLFCFILFAGIAFPRLQFIFMPLLLITSFALGVLVNIVFFFYTLYSCSKKRSFFNKMIIFVVLLTASCLIFIDYYFYNLKALIAQNLQLLLWQALLLGCLVFCPNTALYLKNKFRAKKSLLFLPAALAVLLGLKITAPFDVSVVEKDSIDGVGKVLLEHDLSEGDLILLDASGCSESFFLNSGISSEKFVFADFKAENLLLFKQYLRHIAISYLIMKDSEEFLGLDGVFTKEDEDSLRLDNLVYQKVYADTVYQVWQLDTERSVNLESGAHLFDTYRYLPQNLRLGAERMRKIVNNNKSDYMALTALGRIYAELLTFDKAKKWIRESIAVQDNYADSYLHLAFAYTLEYSLKQNRPYHLYFMAKNLYLRGISLEGANHEYYHLLGDLAEYKGDLAEALKYSEKSLELSGNTCDPSHYRIALFELEEGNKKKAKEHLHLAIANASTHSGDTPDKYRKLLDSLD